MFSCAVCEISKNTFLTEHLWTTASAHSLECTKKLNFRENVTDIVFLNKQTNIKMLQIKFQIELKEFEKFEVVLIRGSRNINQPGNTQLKSPCILNICFILQHIID